jgi:hypothetical protein
MPRAKSSKKNDPNGTRNRAADFDLSEDLIAQQREKDWPLLSPQERCFAEEYCFNGYNHREAAITAGLNPDRGIHLKRQPLIRAFVAHVQSRLFEANIVTRDFVDAKLDELYDMAVGIIETDHIDTKNAESFRGNKFHGSLALDILREKAKLHGVIQGEEDDSDTSPTEIHFHVKGSKKQVRVTRGKRKSSDK